MSALAFTPVIYALTTSQGDAMPAVSASTERTITSMLVANIDGSNSVDIEVYLHNGSSQAALIYGYALDVGKALQLVPEGRGLVLPAGCKIRARASASSDAVMTVLGYDRSVA